MGLNNLQGVETAAFLVLTIIQVTLVAGIQTDTVTTATPSTSSSPPSVFHGIGKRSVSILARNGDLPYYRKEWNKKLHPGFRGMNLENKDDTLVVSQRNVGALARGGGFPMVTGKRDSDRLNSLSSIWPDEAILEEYLAEELRKRLLRRELAAESKNMDVAAEEELEEDPEASEEFTEKRGGVGALARGGYMPTEGRYSSGKRSVAALARSGELLSIGRGSNQDRENGNGATKRGIGSILRNGGISTIGKIPVYNVGNLNNGKRGIESLARNYALPSMLNQEYAKKYDIIDNEGEDITSRQMTEPYNDEFMLAGDNMDAPGMVVQEGMIKRHLGSYARNYGLRLNNKRSIGSIVRNNGVLHYNGKRNEDDIPDYDEDYSVTQKRHIASLLRDGFVPGKRDTEEYASGEGKRHLASIWNDNNSVTKGKRYIGSIARQGLLSGRHEKRDNLEGIYDDDQYTRGDYAVGKRSIAEDQSSSIEGEAYLDQQHGGSAMNSTADAEPKKVAPSTSSGYLQKMSLRQKGDVSEEAKPEKKKGNDEPFSQRQRRSLTIPYTTSDEYPMPVLQNTDFYDWDITDEDEIAGAPDKRFMGSLARWSWFPRQFRRVASGDEEWGENGAAVTGWPNPVTYQLHKRHIGALARLGWLPAIRSQRRYSRGLGKRSVEEEGGGREDTSHGAQPTTNRIPFSIAFTPEAKISLIGIPKEEWTRDELIPVEGSTKTEVKSNEGWRIDDEGEAKLRGGMPAVFAEKRYLLLPAIDHLLLRKLYPRQMLPLIV